MDFGTIIWLSIGAAVFLGAARIIVNIQNKTNMKNSVFEVRNFYPDFQYLSDDGETAISFDKNKQKLCLTNLNYGNVKNNIIDPQDIISGEIFQDGRSITKTSRISQAGYAILGGVLLGGVGAVVGALTSASSTKGKIKRIDLQIIINDTSSPAFNVNFLNDEWEEGGAIHKTALNEARDWLGRINVLIRLANDNDAALERNPLSDSSVADELSKLADLLDRGLLSESEYTQQKRYLLEGPVEDAARGENENVGSDHHEGAMQIVTSSTALAVNESEGVVLEQSGGRDFSLSDWPAPLREKRGQAQDPGDISEPNLALTAKQFAMTRSVTGQGSYFSSGISDEQWQSPLSTSSIKIDHVERRRSSTHRHIIRFGLALGILVAAGGIIVWIREPAVIADGLRRIIDYSTTNSDMVAAPRENRGAVVNPSLSKNPGQTELIGNIQEYLLRLGYPTGPIDGEVGPQTRNAIKMYERDRGAVPTGRPSEELLMSLKTVGPATDSAERRGKDSRK